MLGSVVCTRPFGDDLPLREDTDALVARPPDVMIATTGIGVRSWFAAAESWGLDDVLRDAIGSATIISRGPKAAAALVAAGLSDHQAEPTERLDGLVARLVDTGVRGKRIALQLYGEAAPQAVERLEGAGAEVVAVSVYRWTPTDDLAPAQHLLEQTLAAEVDAVTFTSAAAVRSFAAMAEVVGVGGDLRRVLSSTVVAACVGPITCETAAAIGFERRVAPDRGRLGLLVRSLSRLLHADHRHVQAGNREFVLHGASVWSPDGQIVLTALERTLLVALAARPGALVSRRALRSRVWSNNCSEGTVDTGISRLRRALRPLDLDVDAVSRRGWCLQARPGTCPLAPAEVPSVPAGAGPGGSHVLASRDVRR